MTFSEWLRKCDRLMDGIIGLGVDDVCDAPWRDYFDSEMTPKEAVYDALTIWNNFPDGIWLAEKLGVE